MNKLLHLVCVNCSAVNRVPASRLDDAPKCGKCRQQLFRGTSVAVDSAAFDKHIQRNNIPVLVDFWAPWCGPCKAMAPAYEQLASAVEPKVRLLKVNTEQMQQLAARFAIRSIPTLVLFKAGLEVARQAGAVDAHSLKAWLASKLD